MLVLLCQVQDAKAQEADECLGSSRFELSLFQAPHRIVFSVAECYLLFLWAQGGVSEAGHEGRRCKPDASRCSCSRRCGKGNQLCQQGTRARQPAGAFRVVFCQRQCRQSLTAATYYGFIVRPERRVTSGWSRSPILIATMQQRK